MRVTAIRPTGVERTFGVDELIVSKTDPRGVLTYANDVFLRVSALAEDEALGKAHNIIRHPDMPRAVFKLLWDTLKEHQEIFAYVVNLAADGAHYWVFAHITPSLGPDGRLAGYHSTRRRPDPAAVREVGRFYERIRAAERRHTASPQALDAGYDLLRDTLAARGSTYDEFVWELANGAPA